jgi:uncharacterized membrane protein
LTIKTHRKRTIASAVTYRVTSTVLLAAITYVVSGQIIDSAVITLSFAFLATILYYFNDRAWERTDWGRKTEDSSGALPSGTSQRASPFGSHLASELMPTRHEPLEEAS